MSGRIPLFPPVFAPNVSHPMVDDFSLRAARIQARQQPAGISPVYPLPLRNHPAWSGNNEIGQEAGFAPDSNNRQMITKLSEWGEPTDWTITLGMQHGNVSGGGFDVTAEIFFGIGGTTQYIEVDWLEGAMITLPLNACVINAKYNFQDTEAGPSVPDDLILRATFARYAAGKRRATRSYGFLNGTGAAETFRAIPPFATDMLVLPVGGAAAAFYETNAVSFLAGNQGPGEVGQVQLMQELSYFEPTTPIFGSFQPIPIPPFARYWQIVSVPGGAPADLSCLIRFGLSV